MSNSLAFVFPGQGSQAIGMSSALAAQFPLVQNIYKEASDALGIDLWAMTQEGPIEELSQTQNTQPALLTAGVAAYRCWLEAGGKAPSLMAGHSLGEYTALCCAGALNFADAVALVRDRGRYMQEAVPAGDGGMAAIIGLEDDQVRSICSEVSTPDAIVQAVNFNAPGQVVIAGSTAGIAAAMEALKAAGAKRALPLPVSIPAHSSLMAPASARLNERIAGLDIKVPSIPVVHNCNLEIATSDDQIRANLVSQLDSPVRWVETVGKMTEAGTSQFIESGPGRVLGGMIKRISRESATAVIETPEQINELV